MITCGMSELEITPPIGSSLPGYFEDRRSTGIRDPLYVKAMVIQTETNSIVLVAVDAITVPRQVVVAIRERVAASTGIPSANVMVTATHIHTGPPVMSTSFYQADESYLDWLVMKAADAVLIAYSRRTAVTIGVGSGHEADISFNRRFRMKDGTVRTNPELQDPQIDYRLGPIDPQVVVVRIDDASDGSPIGIITNFTCHTDVVGGTDYSGDYPGALSRALKKVYGEQLISLFLLGACGDINQTDFINGLDEDFIKPSKLYEKMGHILAGEVIKTREKIRTSTQCQMAIESMLFSVGCRQPSADDIAAAKRTLQTESEDSVEYNFALELLKADESKERLVELEIQTIRLGELAILGLPGEPFVELGLEIKEKSPFRYTAVTELTNGTAIAYICTREAYEQGGYEPRITSNSNLAEETSDLLVEHSLSQLQHLYASDIID